MDVESGRARSLAGGGKDVSCVVGGADVPQEGLELNKRLDEEDRAVFEGLVKFGSGVGYAGVDDSARLKAEARELGEAAGHAGARRRGRTDAVDVQSEGVEETDDETFGGCRHVQLTPSNFAAATK